MPYLLSLCIDLFQSVFSKARIHLFNVLCRKYKLIARTVWTVLCYLLSSIYKKNALFFELIDIFPKYIYFLPSGTKMVFIEMVWINTKC